MGRVAIVGAGPGGAVLAFLLARRGVEVDLFERQDDFEREFRGEVVLPGGLQPFAEMGLWDELQAVPHVAPRRLRVYLNGRRRVDASARRSRQHALFWRPHRARTARCVVVRRRNAAAHRPTRQESAAALRERRDGPTRA